MLGSPAYAWPLGPVALNQRLAPEIRFTRLPLPAVDPSRHAAMLELARRTCPGLDSASYLGARLGTYDYVVLGESGGRLLAFELVQEFTVEDARYVYLGPIFSREGACVPLFDALLASISWGASGSFHLLTEMQSPRAALLFKRFFLRSSYPRLSDGAVSERARAVAGEFARRLPHMGTIDWNTLSTRSDETLFRSSPEYAPVVDWMSRRGVQLARGDAQIFVVTCGSSAFERARLRLDVWAGKRALAEHRSEMRRMLERFERGAR